MQPTPDPLKSTQPNLTHWVGLGWFLGLGELGWVTNLFLIVGRVGFGS